MAKEGGAPSVLSTELVQGAPESYQLASGSAIQHAGVFDDPPPGGLELDVQLGKIALAVPEKSLRRHQGHRPSRRTRHDAPPRRHPHLALRRSRDTFARGA